MSILLRRATTLTTTMRRTFSTTTTTTTTTTTAANTATKMSSYLLTHDLASQTGSTMPLSMMRIGTLIHNIELRPGQGGKLVRSAGTSAKILKEPSAAARVLIRLPSGVAKLVDTRCRATIGSVSNPSHGARKLRKAGHSRWLGRRPVVRGMAMNPVDHPHGGGEGRNKGRISCTPWGKPTKGGYKTACPKKKNRDVSVDDPDKFSFDYSTSQAGRTAYAIVSWFSQIGGTRSEKIWKAVDIKEVILGWPVLLYNYIIQLHKLDTRNYAAYYGSKSFPFFKLFEAKVELEQKVPNLASLCSTNID
ncbi:hypothetical protein KSS87_017941 [Heliosperma pusillum]|nr:hypothetical protein KSS87_017941 [Heliosperma pusillum]